MKQFQNINELLEKDTLYKKNVAESKYFYYSLGISEEMLQKKGPITIVVIGSGGKTTCIDTLAQEFISLGKKVIVTTTTNMYLPRQNGVILDENNRGIQQYNGEIFTTKHNEKIKVCSCRETFIKLAKKELEKNSIVVVGKISEKSREKMSGLENSLLDKLKEETDILLIEADGSKRLPLKFPNDEEPVWVEHMDVIVLCIGLDSLNKPLFDVCHRASLASERCNINETDIVTKEIIVSMLQHGYMKKEAIKNRTNTLYSILLTKGKLEDLESSNPSIQLGKFLKENIICDNVVIFEKSKEEKNLYV